MASVASAAAVTALRLTPHAVTGNDAGEQAGCAGLRWALLSTGLPRQGYAWATPGLLPPFALASQRAQRYSFIYD